MFDNIYKDLDKKMSSAVKAFQDDIAKLRTGRASLSLLDGIMVNYYGNPSPLNQVATLSVPDSRTITIQPWESKLIVDIEKSIAASDIGLSPANDGKVIRLTIPILTEERRNDLVKKLGKNVEAAKVAIRNIRRIFNEDVKKLEKNKEITEDESKKILDDIQKKTDDFIKKIDEISLKKEKEIKEI